MKNREKILFWIPRVLSIVYIGFLALFALDVFQPGGTFGYYVVAFLMHLIPNFILLALLIVAWKYEIIGGILFLLSGIIFTFFFETYAMLVSFLLISVPVFLIGVFFLYNGYKKRVI